MRLLRRHFPQQACRLLLLAGTQEGDRQIHAHIQVARLFVQQLAEAPDGLPVITLLVLDTALQELHLSVIGALSAQTPGHVFRALDLAQADVLPDLIQGLLQIHGLHLLS